MTKKCLNCNTVNDLSEVLCAMCKSDRLIDYYNDKEDEESEKTIICNKIRPKYDNMKKINYTLLSKNKKHNADDYWGYIDTKKTKSEALDHCAFLKSENTNFIGFKIIKSNTNFVIFVFRAKLTEEK